MINCVKLEANGRISDIKTRYDEIHLLLNGGLTFVGAIASLDVVALANRDVVLTVPNVFCKTLAFEPTSSDIILVKTCETGEPVSLFMENLKTYVSFCDE